MNNGWVGVTRIADNDGDMLDIIGGSISVISGDLTNSKTIWNEVGSIATLTETDIVILIVPIGKTAIIIGASGEAKENTIFKLYHAGSVKGKRRNAWTDRNVDFNIRFVANAGEIVKVTARHKGSGLQDISASLVYIEL